MKQQQKLTPLKLDISRERIRFLACFFYSTVLWQTCSAHSLNQTTQLLVLSSTLFQFTAINVCMEQYWFGLVISEVKSKQCEMWEYRPIGGRDDFIYELDILLGTSNSAVWCIVSWPKYNILVKNYHMIWYYQLPGSLMLFYSFKFYIFPHQHSVQNFVARRAWPPLWETSSQGHK